MVHLLESMDIGFIFPSLNKDALILIELIDETLLFDWWNIGGLFLFVKEYSYIH
jgi:hypothetical protein